MIDKLIFLHHGGSSLTQGPVTPGDGGTTAGLVMLGLLVVAAVGMWMYFTRKKY